MKRLDTALVEWGFAPSRTKAQELIESGDVEIRGKNGWRPALDNSENIEPLSSADVRIARDAGALKYVSRGGLKIEAAFAHLKLNPSGWRCIDAGISTGGFTDFLLKNGAARVFGFDVGHGQLHSSLASDKRLVAVENLNVKDLAESDLLKDFVQQGVDLCVADLSFISLELALPAFSTVLSTGTPLLALVKPQFEVGRQTATPELFDDVRGRVLRAADKYGFSCMEYFPSPVKGQDGNQEFFLYCRRR